MSMHAFTTPLSEPLSEATLQQRNTTREKDANDPRGYYFRDATAILHCTSFRRLKHKTQVFFAPSNDHVCTRLEHVLHVSTIAVTICRALGLNADLAWAIGLGHDLGHTPFGHLGERVLGTLIESPFLHELHSLRVVDRLACLNLTFASRDGIVSHCGEKFEQYIVPTHKAHDVSTYTDRTYYPATFEGCVVRMADKIAYLGRDYEDAVMLKVVHDGKLPLPILRALGSDDNSDIINTFTLDLIEYSKKNGTIGFSKKIFEIMKEFKEYNYREIYESATLLSQSKKFERILTVLYETLITQLEKYHNDLHVYDESDIEVVQAMGHHIQQHGSLYDITKKQDRIQILVDFIASMTDDYVINSVKQILFPKITISKL